MLGSVIRSHIAPILRECPAACGIVSITTVEVSADFTFATVSITSLFDPKLALEFLLERRSELQSRLARMEAHRTPKLRFRIDTDAERATRVDALLEKASKRNADDTSIPMQDQPSEK